LKFTSLHVLVSGHTCWIQYQALHSNQIQYAADNFQLEQLYWPDTLVLCNQPLLACMTKRKAGGVAGQPSSLPRNLISVDLEQKSQAWGQQQKSKLVGVACLPEPHAH
jgi:hypothetical protein